MKFIPTGLSNFHITRVGSRDRGAKILCLHGGFGLDSSYFLPYFEPLAEDFNLYFYTQGTSNVLSVDGLINELMHARRAVGEGKVFLLAHSAGAALLFECLKRHSFPLDGLILMSWIYDMEWLQRYFKRFPPSADEEDEQYESDEQFKRAMLRIADRYFLPLYVEEGKRVLSQIHYNVTLYDIFSKSMASTYDAKQVIEKLSFPILSIVGSEDQITDVDYVRAGVNLNPRIQTCEIAGAGISPLLKSQWKQFEPFLFLS